MSANRGRDRPIRNDLMNKYSLVTRIYYDGTPGARGPHDMDGHLQQAHYRPGRCMTAGAL